MTARRTPGVPTGPPRAVRALLLACPIFLLLMTLALVVDAGPLDRAWWGTWGYNLFFVLVSGLLLARATRPQGRTGWTLVALGYTVTAAGNWVHLAGVPVAPHLPWSPVDLMWITGYGLQAAGVLALLLAGWRGSRSGAALDGVVAALGAAAVAALAYGAVGDLGTKADGHQACLVALLAYPTADLVIVSIIFGALAVLRWPLRGTWGLLGAGFLVSGLADLTYLVLASNGTYALGTLLDAVWPVGAYLVVLAAWHPAPRPVAEDGARGLVMPAVVTFTSLGVFLADTLDHPTPVVAKVLAAAAVSAVVLRTALTIRAVAELTETRRIATTDDLTGLANRRALAGRLAAVVDDRGGPRPVALVVCGLDRFKEVNDALGHAVGDDLLRQLAARLTDRTAGPGVDGVLVARTGGDEFALLLPGAGRVQAQAAADRVLAALADPFALDGVALHVDVSIGMALHPEHAADADALLRCADVALHDAKRGRGGPRMYDAMSDTVSRERLETIEQLREGLRTGQLVCHYQPKAELGTGRVVGAEALVRWQHPGRGLLAPDTFLALAEQTGLMRRLTAVVLEEALGACRRWREEHPHLSVAVNLSVTSLLDAGLPLQVVDVLERHGLPATALELEITESDLMADPDRARDTVDRLRSLGVAVSVDDYGTGYSSLAYLRRLSLDEIKLDKSFIAGLGRNDRDTAIVRSTIDLAHALGLRLVAEGVETAEEWDLLRLFGCDLAQGYHLSRPVPGHAFLELVRSRAAALPTAGR